MIIIPNITGFYLEDGSICKFADSKQISTNKYILQHDLYYRAKNGTLFIVKRGFIHDGASKGFLKHFGKYTNAAILHDALYGVNYNRSASDDLFLEAMKYSDVSWVRRYTYWSIVRAAGWSAFNAKTPESINKCKSFLTIKG